MKEQRCPFCTKNIDTDAMTWEYNPLAGREGKCPECGKKIFLQRQPRGLVNGKDGNLVRRFRK